MFRPRVIPVLLLKNNGLAKSVNFKDHRYIGDPINAVKLFNNFKADELVFLDIYASKEKRLVSLDFVKKVGEEANMPFAVGGGITSLNDIKAVLNAGAEKVVINASAVQNPSFIKEAANTFGSSTIAVCMDVKKKFLSKEKKVFTINGSKASVFSPVDFAKKMEELGAGEIIVQSVEKDGTMSGYDLELIKQVSGAVTIPVVALGGAGTLAHLKQAVIESNASAVAAGSMFVYHGPRRAVLVNYPSRQELNTLFS